MRPCPLCDGDGHDELGIWCSKCEGTGRRPPERSLRDLLADLKERARWYRNARWFEQRHARWNRTRMVASVSNEVGGTRKGWEDEYTRELVTSFLRLMIAVWRHDAARQREKATEPVRADGCDHGAA